MAEAVAVKQPRKLGQMRRRGEEELAPLEAISPYKNMGPQERLLPKLKARLNRHRRNNNLSLHEGKSEDLDFRRLVQSIFDQTSNNPYASAVERKHRQWQRPDEDHPLYQSVIASDSALRRHNKRTLRIVDHHRTISHEDGSAKGTMQNLLSQLTIVAGEPSQTKQYGALERQVEPNHKSPVT